MTRPSSIPDVVGCARRRLRLGAGLVAGPEMQRFRGQLPFCFQRPASGQERAQIPINKMPRGRPDKTRRTEWSSAAVGSSSQAPGRKQQMQQYQNGAGGRWRQWLNSIAIAFAFGLAASSQAASEPRQLTGFDEALRQIAESEYHIRLDEATGN